MNAKSNSANSPITFAAFHAFFKKPIEENIKQFAKTYTNYEQEKLLMTLFKSARKFHPDCRCVVLTNEKTKIAASPDYTIVRYDVDVRKPMFAITQARTEYLKEADGSSHIIFIDTDMLVQQNLDALFELDFDIALTYRADFSCDPINAGLFFINRLGIAKALSFFEESTLR